MHQCRKRHFGIKTKFNILKADAAYSLDGTILSIFPVFGSGPMYLELTDLDIKVFTALTLSEEGYIKVRKRYFKRN